MCRTHFVYQDLHTSILRLVRFTPTSVVHSGRGPTEMSLIVRNSGKTAHKYRFVLTLHVIDSYYCELSPAPPVNLAWISVSSVAIASSSTSCTAQTFRDMVSSAPFSIYATYTASIQSRTSGVFLFCSLRCARSNSSYSPPDAAPR
jgi:hypothetical protein